MEKKQKKNGEKIKKLKTSIGNNHMAGKGGQTWKRINCQLQRRADTSLV